MTSYAITGFQMKNCTDAAVNLLSLLEMLSPDSGDFCVEAHFKTIDAMKRLADDLLSSRFALYCWRNMENPAEFSRQEFQSIRTARLLFDSREIHINSDPPMPPYDWNGKVIDSVHVGYTERESKPQEPGSSRPSARTQRLFQGAVERITGNSATVHVRDSASAKSRAYSYSSVVHLAETASLVEELCRQFELSRGLGSFEFLGTAAEIEMLALGGQYSLSEFPAGCWSFNASAGKTPFALARYSFCYPVLNVPRGDLTRVAALIDSFDADLSQISIIRKYVSWKLMDGRCSPKCQGNYALVSREKTGYELSVGFEQYADADPSVKQYLKFATPFLSARGIGLKRMPNVR
jgi:hypothetical protein